MFHININNGRKFNNPVEEALKYASGVAEVTTGEKMEVILLVWNRTGQNPFTMSGWQDTSITYHPSSVEPEIRHGVEGSGNIRFESDGSPYNRLVGRVAKTKHNMKMLASHFYQNQPNTHSFRISDDQPERAALIKEVEALAKNIKRNTRLDYEKTVTMHDLPSVEAGDPIVAAMQKRIEELESKLKTTQDVEVNDDLKIADSGNVAETRRICKKYGLSFPIGVKKDEMVKQLKEKISQRDDARKVVESDISPLVEETDDNTGNGGDDTSGKSGVVAPSNTVGTQSVT